MEGIKDWKNKKKDAENKLKEYLEDNFRRFRNVFKEAVSEWTGTTEAKEIINKMELSMALFGEEQRGYLLFGDKCEEIFPDSGQKKEYIQEALEKEYCNKQWEIQVDERNEIQNTGTGISDILQGPFHAIWIMGFEKSGVNEIVASVVLFILREMISNLNMLEFEDKEYVCQLILKKSHPKFMDLYSSKLLEKYQMLPEIQKITEILDEKYEKRENNASVYFMNEESFSDIDLKVSFDHNCRIKGEDNIAGFRKLLEACANSERCLAVSENSKEVMGIIPKKSTEGHGGLSIHFKENKWEIRKGDVVLLKYKSGRLYINSQDEKETLREKCIKAGLEYEIFGKIFEMLKNEAMHGALVIIAEDAKKEVDFLCKECNRGVKIEPLQLKEEKDCTLLSGLANVDGAIFFDYEGYCYGFSVILDGEAMVKGNPAKGSRYNSAVNYIANSDSMKRCAFIRSEDKEKEIEIVSGKMITDRVSRYRKRKIEE